MIQTATRFLARSFSPEETIAVLLRRTNPPALAQRIVRAEQVMAPRYLAWLGHENLCGANVYIAANPLLPGSRKRTKENVACVRHLYLDIDEDGEARLAALRASLAVPPPNTVLRTSPGKYQVLWRVEGFGFERQESALKVLAMTFGGDPACTDRNRVLRVPGFSNRKYDPPCLVTVEYPEDSVWTPDDFQLENYQPIPVASASPEATPKPPLKHSHSEDDWAWVWRELCAGKDAGKVTQELAARRAEKPNPLYYARRTVDVASACIWLGSGIRINDVIALLEARRRSEFAGALCSARAREIAETARRMMSARKTA